MSLDTASVIGSLQKPAIVLQLTIIDQHVLTILSLSINSYKKKWSTEVQLTT